jgi:hypothetical protein
MERNSTNENFEHFLRQNAEEFRMHPSPKVWDGISETLTKRKRRFYFGLATLLISSSILGYTLLDFSFGKTVTTTATTFKAPAEVRSPVSSRRINELASKKSNVVTLTVNQPVNKFSKARAGVAITPVSNAVPEDNGSTDNLAIQRQIWMADLLTSPFNNSLNGLSASKNLFDFKFSSLNTEENAIKLHRRNSKFETMFFFTPTVSYRNLSENKSYLRSTPIGVPYSYAALYDVNNAVTHRPNIGLELGVTSKYSITKNVKLRAGLQFNINRYDIKAFKYTPERATIALNNGSSGVQSVTAASTYRNFNGGETDWLQNFYFQVSTPIGAEVKLHGSDKMYIGAASTIQPTYVLGDRAYLITADYKNYAQVPWLMRRWNVNTNLETFVAYSTGKLKWQVGPQVRYQLLSSFVNEYPVKENLFDFGLKVGLSVNKNQ